MNVMKLKSGWQRTVAALLGVVALLGTVACGTSDMERVSAQALTTQQNGVPVVVSCEPHQRTLVRPVVVNGATVSQVECVAASQLQTAGNMSQPLQPAYQPVSVRQPVYAGDADLGDARVVQPAYPATRTVARTTPARQVVYREPVNEGRSVKKSAIIIGSSAGVGAGVGAAVGGKKGALIGAAIGGGSAAIWDQVTRRK